MERHDEADTTGNERCQAIRDDLSAWLDGELSRDAARTINSHLDACPACGRLVSELKQDWELLSHLPAPVLAESPGPQAGSFAAAVRRRSLAAPRHSEFSKRQRVQRFTAVAAAIAAALLVALLFGRQLLDEQESSIPEQPGVADVDERELELLWYLKENAELIAAGDTGIYELIEELEPEEHAGGELAPAGPVAFEYILEEELERL